MNTGVPWGLGRGNAGQLCVWAAKGERDRDNRLLSVGALDPLCVVGERTQVILKSVLVALATTILGPEKGLNPSRDGVATIPLTKR